MTEIAARFGNVEGRGRMTGRRVLVIGGGQDDRGLPPEETPIGNGRAISVLAAREGAAVVVTDLVAERAADTAALIEAEGHRALSIEADASDEAAMTRAFATATEWLGGLDAVVANVGIGGPTWLSGTSAAAWDRVLAANTRSAFLACKLAVEHLEDDGAVVLISSIAGLRPGSRIPAYDTSKAALGGLARHAGFEGRRRRLRVNVVAPGLIDTSIGREATRHRPNRTAGTLPLGRQGTAWEIAYATVFLLSDEASYINGQTLAVDGGLTTIG